jgi:putative Mn2+ efflux pump MntP
MGWLSLLSLAVALAMDAFAVAIVTGLTLNPMTGRQVFRLAFHFGLFQALMPTIGWLAGHAVQKYISAFDHWVAFGLLAFVGGKMLWEGWHGEEDEKTLGDPTSGWALLLLSIATSIDALAVGLSAAGFTATGMLLGQRIGTIWGKRVEVLGGLILIGIGIKIVVEHLS